MATLQQRLSKLEEQIKPRKLKLHEIKIETPEDRATIAAEMVGLSVRMDGIEISDVDSKKLQKIYIDEDYHAFEKAYGIWLNKIKYNFH